MANETLNWLYARRCRERAYCEYEVFGLMYGDLPQRLWQPWIIWPPATLVDYELLPNVLAPW